MRRKVNATALAACALCALLLGGCATASAGEPEPTCGFMSVSDIAAPKEPEGAVRIAEEQAGKAAQAEQEAAEAAAQAEAEYGYQEPYYEPYGSSYGYHGNPDGLNSFDGVNQFNGMTETFYGGSNAVYRGELWADEDGFLRTADGYYAVATNNDEIPQGTVIETSQGQAMVVDGGAGSGVVDFCVEGWC